VTKRRVSTPSPRLAAARGHRVPGHLRFGHQPQISGPEVCGL
jgi:hypothetical protein